MEAFHVLLVQNSLKTPKTALKLESDTESFKTTFVNLKCVNFQITVKQCKYKKLFSADPNIHFYPGLVVFCDRLASIYPESLQQASMGPQEHSPANFIEQSVCRETVALLFPECVGNL